jgi:PAP2 superfamily
MESHTLFNDATQAKLKQLFAVNKISLFPSVGSWIALGFLVSFNAVVIALSAQLTFEMSFVYSLLPSFLITPLLIWISSLQLIASNRLSKRFFECLLLLMFFIPMFVSLAVFGTVTMWLTANFPLADNLLDGCDKELALNWIGYTKWLVGHPQFMLLSAKCYMLLCPALFIVGLEAVVGGEPERCKSFIYLTLTTCIFAIVVGGFFPSYGSVVHLASDDLRSHLPPGTGTEQMAMLVQIRGGLATHIDPRRLVGLVSFPSFHTIACILLIYGSRGNILRLSAVSVFSFMMLVATPVFGEHYLVDILFGIAVAIAFIFIERWFRARRANLDLA